MQRKIPPETASLGACCAQGFPGKVGVVRLPPKIRDKGSIYGSSLGSLGKQQIFPESWAGTSLSSGSIWPRAVCKLADDIREPFSKQSPAPATSKFGNIDTAPGARSTNIPAKATAKSSSVVWKTFPTHQPSLTHWHCSITITSRALGKHPVSM